MLSKSKGQVLRVAAVLHVLFRDNVDEEEVADTCITTNAILAAQNFVDICCQHAAFITGRDKIDNEIKQFTSGKHSVLFNVTSATWSAQRCGIRDTCRWYNK